MKFIKSTLICAVLAGALPTPSLAARIRECGDAAANYPNAGAFNITSRVTHCPRARKAAIRWYYRGEHSPFGFACRKRRSGGGWDVRCTKPGGRVVRFQYYVPS
jgi:hypothetical protein